MDPNDVRPLEDDLVQPSDVRAFESGKYKTLARLGEGGMADVFLTALRGAAGFNKLVVIKRLKAALSRDAEYRAMFLDEARLAARLSHPNVVQTYEVTEAGSVFFMTMEYLDGIPLSRLMRSAAKQGRKIHPNVYAHLCAEALAGLHYAHELCDFDGTPLRIVHRDVSPQNVFVTYDGQVKLVDFGIAKAEVSSSKTQAGILKGKASYMAPEQVVGACDRRADLFSMGIVLWELLTGRRLMTGETMAQTLWRVVRDPVERPSTFEPTVNPQLEAIVMRALEREPEVRYQTAQEMRNALVDYIENSGHYVRQQEVADLLKDMFGRLRAQTQAKIKEKMAEIGSQPGSGMLDVGSSGSIRIEGVGPLSTGTIGNFHLPTPVSAMSLKPSDQSDPALVPPTAVSATSAGTARRRIRWVGAGLAMVLIGGAGGALLGRKGQTPPPETRMSASVEATAVATAPPAQSSAAPAPPATSAPPVEPAAPHISLNVTSRPAAAPRAIWRPPAHAATHEAASAPASVPAPPPVAERPPAPSAPPVPAPASTPQGRRIRTEL